MYLNELINNQANILETKMNNILNHRKSKRGIVNGLGYILNTLTGIMDDSDRQRIDYMLLNKN